MGNTSPKRKRVNTEMLGTSHRVQFGNVDPSSQAPQDDTIVMLEHDI